jgi:hypothetical protein
VNRTALRREKGVTDSEKQKKMNDPFVVHRGREKGRVKTKSSGGEQ